MNAQRQQKTAFPFTGCAFVRIICHSKIKQCEFVKFVYEAQKQATKCRWVQNLLNHRHRAKCLNILDFAVILLFIARFDHFGVCLRGRVLCVCSI